MQFSPEILTVSDCFCAWSKWAPGERQPAGGGAEIPAWQKASSCLSLQPAACSLRCAPKGVCLGPPKSSCSSKPVMEPQKFPGLTRQASPSKPQIHNFPNIENNNPLTTPALPLTPPPPKKRTIKYFCLSGLRFRISICYTFSPSTAFTSNLEITNTHTHSTSILLIP